MNWFRLLQSSALPLAPVREPSPDAPSQPPNLPLAAARYRLGLLPSSELPSLAMAALEAGLESSSFCELVGEPHPTLVDHGPVFERALRQCSIALPSTAAAIDYLLRHYLQAIASGALPPRQGMFQVIKELYHPHIDDQPAREYVGDQCGLQHLIGAFYSYDELEERPREVSFEGLYGPAAIPAFDRYVRQLAKDWLQQNGPKA